MAPQKRKRRPIGRQLLVALTRDMGLDSRVVTEAELDEWTAKLKAEPTRYRQGRLVMERFLPWLCDRMERSTGRMRIGLAARDPSEN